MRARSGPQGYLGMRVEVCEPGPLNFHMGPGEDGRYLGNLCTGPQGEALHGFHLTGLRVGLESFSSWPRERWRAYWGWQPISTFALSLRLPEELGLWGQRPSSPSQPLALLSSGPLPSWSTWVLTAAHGWAQALSTQCGICLTGRPAPRAGGHLCLCGVLCQPHAAAYQPPL